MSCFNNFHNQSYQDGNPFLVQNVITCLVNLCFVSKLIMIFCLSAST